MWAVGSMSPRHCQQWPPERRRAPPTWSHWPKQLPGPLRAQLLLSCHWCWATARAGCTHSQRPIAAVLHPKPRYPEDTLSRQLQGRHQPDAGPGLHLFRQQQQRNGNEMDAASSGPGGTPTQRTPCGCAGEARSRRPCVPLRQSCS